MQLYRPNYKQLVLLVGIIIVALIVRIWGLSSNPYGFFCDEASIGYNAYSILTTGKDEHGTPLPLFFAAFGEYKSPIQTYSTIPYISIWGMSEFSVRLTSALYGVLSVVALYFLSRHLFKHQEQNSAYAPLIAAGLLAISTWHIHFSRVALEGLMPFLLFTILGLYLFLKAQTKPNIMIISTITFAVAIYSYFPARIFIPLFAGGLVILYYKFFYTHRKITLLCVTLGTILLTPMVLHLTDTGVNRWNQVSIFSNPPQSGSTIQHIASNYISHFSYDFLFAKGDSNMPGQFITRHSVQEMGQLYMFQLPLILLGFYYFYKKNKRILAVTILWLLLYPTGSMLTVDQSAQATRSIVGVIPFQVLSASGIIGILTIFKGLRFVRAFFVCALLFMVVTSFTYFLQKYFVEYPQYSSDFWGWQFGAQEIVQYFAENQHNYDETLMEGAFNAPEIFFKFYAPNSCKTCRLGIPHQDYNPNIKQLFAVTNTYLQEHPEPLFKIKKTIYYPNGNIAFVIGEIVQ